MDSISSSSPPRSTDFGGKFIERLDDLLPQLADDICESGDKMDVKERNANIQAMIDLLKIRMAYEKRIKVDERS